MPGEPVELAYDVHCARETSRTPKPAATSRGAVFVRSSEAAARSSGSPLETRSSRRRPAARRRRSGLAFARSPRGFEYYADARGTATRRAARPSRRRSRAPACRPGRSRRSVDVDLGAMRSGRMRRGGARIAFASWGDRTGTGRPRAREGASVRSVRRPSTSTRRGNGLPPGSGASARAPVAPRARPRPTQVPRLGRRHARGHGRRGATARSSSSSRRPSRDATRSSDGSTTAGASSRRSRRQSERRRRSGSAHGGAARARAVRPTTGCRSSSTACRRRGPSSSSADGPAARFDGRCESSSSARRTSSRRARHRRQHHAVVAR